MTDLFVGLLAVITAYLCRDLSVRLEAIGNHLADLRHRLWLLESKIGAHPEGAAAPEADRRIDNDPILEDD